MRARMGYAVAWLLATMLATAISLTAVRLVGAQATESFGPPLPAIESVATSASQTTTGTTAPADDSTISTIELSDPSIPAPEFDATATTTTTTTGTSLATTTTTVLSTTSTTAPATTTTSTTTPAVETTTTTSVPASTGPFTFSVTGGSVTITCQNDDISLNGAVPASGFVVDVEKSGPGEVRVEFTKGEIEVEIRIECEGGVPIEEIND